MQSIHMYVECISEVTVSACKVQLRQYTAIQSYTLFLYVGNMVQTVQNGIKRRSRYTVPAEEHHPAEERCVGSKE